MVSTPIAQRVEYFDVLRGLAIVGMFSVNMTADLRWSDSFESVRPWSADFLALAAVNLLANGKFITLFSFLFGVGFFVQSDRQMAAGGSVPTFWIKRLLGLLMIGLLANALTLPAWILVDYSLFGLGLLVCYRWPARWILLAAVFCLAVSMCEAYVYPVLWPSPERDSAVVTTVLGAVHASQEQVMREGTFLQLSGTALVHMWEEFRDWRYFAADLYLLGLMLAGLWVGRCGAVWNRDARLALARKTAPWLLGIGFVSCTAWLVITNLATAMDLEIRYPALVRMLFWPFGSLVLGLGYAAGVALLMDKARWEQRLGVFAPIGRMALTNYLFTGFVIAFITFQWGLGAYGKLFPALGLSIVLLLLPVQIGFSRWWLAHFRLGPFEWLWRCWTYGCLLPIRR